jgi:hypothetical protein
MRVTRDEKKFNPLIITLETQEEIDIMYLALLKTHVTGEIVFDLIEMLDKYHVKNY